MKYLFEYIATTLTFILTGSVIILFVTFDDIDLQRTQVILLAIGLLNLSFIGLYIAFFKETK